MNRNIITVRQDGKGDYTAITPAVMSALDPSESNQYEIIIHPGVYLEKNIRMKPHVSLRGTDRDTCIIRGETPASAPDDQITPVSTIDWNTSGTIKDLTVTCKNMRYPIHSDGGAYGNKDGRQEIINCRLEHLGNQEVVAYRAANGLPPGAVWSSLHAWGCGTSDGMVIIAMDSTFVSPTTAFYFHENMTFENPSYVELKNCKMIATNENGCAICVQGYGSGRNGKLVVNNCEITGFTDIYSGCYLPESLALAYFQTVECTFAGGGNTLSPVRIYTSIYALRITSSSDGSASSIRLGGVAAAALFAVPTYMDGAGGIKGYAEGTTDIADSNPNTPITGLGRRLGNRTSEPWTLDIVIDGGAPLTIVFGKDYTEMANRQVMEIIQNAIGNGGVVSQVGIGLDYYPEYADQIMHLINTTSEGIFKGMAAAYDSSFKNCRKMTNADDADDFVGIALDDIRPGDIGRILTKGIVFDSPGGKAADNGNHGIRQLIRHAAVKGDKFGISDEPGCFEKDALPVIMKCVAPNLVKF